MRISDWSSDVCSSDLFFHHFKSKEDVAVQAARHWSEVTGALFASAPYHRHRDPLDRAMAYLVFRPGRWGGGGAGSTCWLGPRGQGTFSPNLRTGGDTA